MVSCLAVCGGPVGAAIIYWDNSGGTANDWGSVANWSTVLAGGTNPAAIPGAADIATFSATPIQGTLQTVNLNGARSVLGLDFLAANIAATTLQGGGTNQTLTLGTSGITMSAGAGAVTIGSATTGQQVAVTLGGAQSWTNNSSSLLTVTNGVTNGGNLLTVTGSGNTTMLGIIAGAGGITKTGAGLLTLSGVNTYTGVTTLSAGTLRATTSAQALGTGAATLSLGGGTLELANDTGLSFSRNTTVTANAAITADRLTSAATATTHTLGTLSMGAQTLTINRGGNITGTATGGVTFGAATLTGAATFSPQANALLTFSSTTALGANTFTKSGAGSMTLTGVVSGSTAVGTTAMTISNGLLTASGANTFTGNIAVSGSGVFAMAGATYTTTAPYGTVTGGTAYKQLLLTNGGTFRLTSGTFNNNAPTTTNIAGGIIFNIGTGGATFDIASGAILAIDDGTGTGTATTASQLQGTGTITKTGLGTFQQDDSTAFAGAMIIAAGNFQPATANAGGATSAGTTIQSGAQYNVNGITMTNQEPLTISGAGLASAPVGALTNLSGTAATWVGPITLGGAATIGSSAAGGLTLSSTATVGTAGNALTFTTAGSGRIFVDGVISGTGSVVFNGTSTGDYVPRADHTYSGGTTLSSGLVAVDRDSTGPAGAPTAGAFGTGGLTLAGSQLRAGTNANRTIGNPVTLSGDTTFFTIATEKSITFSGPVTLSGGNRTLTANAGTTVGGIATIFTGAIGDGGGNLGLTKAGTGNLILAGANTYTGGTAATSGTLLVTGSLANSTGLSLVPATAGGAVVSFINNAANTPADVTSLSVGSVAGPSILGLDLGTASDSIVTSAAATATNAIAFHVNAASGFGAGTYTLISAASGLTAGGATYGLSTAPGGYTYAFDNTDSLVRLTTTGATAGSRYWRGNLNNSWAAFSGTSTTNWATDAAGTTVSASTPGAGDTVLFSATGATGPALATTLDNPFTVNDLQFLSAPAGVTSVAVNPGVNPGTLAPGTLTIAPTSGTSGLTLAQAAGAVTIAAPITLGAPQTWSVDSSAPASGTASSLTVSGAISGSAANGVSFTTTAGTTPIVLSAANTYAGASTVSANTIVQGGIANGFSPNTAWTVNGTLNTGAFNQNTGSLAGGAGIVQNASATNATLTIGSDNLASATFPGTIQNGSTGTLGLTKAGTGTQILSGSNTYTGTTTVTAGTLRIAAASAYPTTSALVVNGTGTFDLFGNSLTAASLAGGATTGIITNSSSSTGASTATAPGTPSGLGVYVDALTGTAAANLPTATVTDGPTRKTQLVINNANSGTAFAGLSATTANTYSGGTVLAHNAATGTRLTINATPTGTPFGTGPIILGQSTTDKAGIFFSAALTFPSPIVFNTALGSDRVGVRADAAVTLSGVITANLAPATFTSNNSISSFTLTNQVTGPSGLVLDIVSSGAAATAFNVTLNNATANANNYQGDTVINFNATTGKSATLTLGAANQLPNGAGTGTVVINTNTTGVGTLNLAGFSDTINGLSGNGTVDGTSGTPTLTLGDNNATATFSGIIRNTAGTLTLAKIGSGTQTLSGASTFTGPVNVNGGLIAFASSPATSGPLGNSSVVNLNGGGLSYTASGTNALNRAIAIGAGGGTLDVVSAAGTLTVPGASVTSSGGSLVKTGPGSIVLAGTTTLNGGLAGVVVSGGTLLAGFGASGINSISVGDGGSLLFQNSTAEALTLGASGTVLTLASGVRLGFELDGTSSDSITVPTGGGIALSGGFTFDFLNTGSGISANTYTLLTAPAGSALNSFTYTLGSAPLGYNYSFLTSDTQVLLQTVAYTPTYWSGGTDGSWATATNFASDAAGTTVAGQTPLATDTVIFNATNAVGPTIATTLDGSLTVDSLQFNGAGTPAATAVNIAQGTGGTLTLKPASASGGIAILASGGSAAISAPVTLDNTLSANQAWNVVDASSVLTLSGDVVFGANVNKAGAGTVVLGGSNSGPGSFSLNAGGLHLNSASALGTGTLSIAVGTTLDNTSGGAVAATASRPVNINGDFTFTGSSSLGLGSGPVTISGNPTVTVLGNTLTLGGAISGTSSLTKAGAGSLVLNGARSFNGSLTINAGALTLGGNSTGSGTVTLAGAGLNLGHPGALGTGGFVINGGTIDNTSGGPLTNANVNPTTISGSFAFTGTNDLNLGTGAIGLTGTPTVTVAANTLTLAGNITGGTSGLTKSGAGTLTLSGTNAYTGNTLVNGGTLNITGSITGNTTTSRLDYGTTAGTTIVNHSGSLNAWVTRGADVAGAISVFNQTAGTVTIVPTIGQDQQYLANNGGYGMLNITGGTFTTGRFDGTGNTNGNGSTAVIYVGGTGSLTQNVGDFFLPIRNSGMMSMSVGPGGTFTRSAAVTQVFSLTGLSMSSANNASYGILNVAGGTVDTGARGINFSSGTFATGTFTSTGFVNVSGGTLLLGLNTGVGAAAGTTSGYFNFVGGTLKATAAMTAVVPASTANYTFTSTLFGPVTNNNSGNAAFNTQVGTTSNFTGGLVVDTNTFSVAFTNPLLAADGTFGVTQPDITIPTSGNSGYVGAPMVQFAAPAAAGGVPASGYALISGGQVTGIVITSPGTYAASETPLVTLTGGGGSIAPFNTAALATANTAAGVMKSGTGTLILSGANTYTGPTVITAGTLQLGGAGTSGSLSPSSAISNSGTLAFNRTDTLTQGTDFAATIGGSGGLSQAGSGTVVLNGVNTYSGATTLTAGTLSVAATSNLGDATSNLVFDGGTLQITGTTLASLSGIGHAVSFNTGKTVGFDINAAAHTFTADQALGQGTGGLSKFGAGTLVLSQANTYTGATTITGGTLVISGATNTGAATVTVSSGSALTVNTGGSLTTTGTLGMGAVSSGSRLTVQAGGSVNVGPINNAWGASYAIDGTLTSSGTWTVSTNRTTDTFNGTGTITASALTIGNASTGVNYTGTGSINLAGALTIASNANTGNASYSQTSGTLNAGSILLGDSTTNTTGTRTFSLIGGRVNVGAGGIASTGTTTATRAINLGAGTLGARADWTGSLGVSLTSASPGVTIDTLDSVDGTTGRTVTLSGILSGVGSLTKASAGTLILSGANTFSGTSTVSGGTLALNNNLALQNSVLATTGAGTIVFGSGVTTPTIGGLSGATGDLATVVSSGYGGVTGLTLNPGTGTSVSYGGVISEGATGMALTKTGAGTQVLAGVNTYTGTTTINQGTLKLTGTAVLGGATGSAADANNIVFGQALDSGVLEFDTVANLGPADQIRFRNTGGTAGLGGALVYVGTTNETLSKAIQCDTSIGIRIESNSAAGSLTLNGAFSQTNRAIYLGGSGAGANTLASVFTGTGGLTKRDAGKWILSGTNTYSGLTTIDQGTLAFAADQTMTGGLVFGAANGGANAGTLDLSAANGTFASLLVRTNTAVANAVTVGAGETLAIAGNVTLGYDAAGGTGASRSNLTVSGAGGMSVTGTTITIGTNQAAVNQAYWNEATLDVAALSSFSTNVTTFNIGVGANTQGPGTVLLSNTANTVVATTLAVGDTGGNNGRGPGTLVFGTGSNIVRADTIQIGRGKNSGNGIVQFVSQDAASPGTVVITNKAGTGAANITVGSNGATGGTGGGAVGTLDLRGHVATVTAATLSIGTNSMTSLTGGVSGTVQFDAGTFSATTVSLGIKTGANTGGANGTLNIGGGSFTVNAGGSFTLGSQASAGTATATLNLTGGTFTSNVDILDGGGASSSTINVDGGILDMVGRSIGNATNVIDVLTLASGGLRNVAQINNGSAITKTTAGTLSLSGSSSYTGQTLVQAGTLAFDSIANVGGGASALGAPATVGAGTIPIGTSTIGAALQYLGAATASTDRVIDLAGTTGGVTLDSSGSGAITFGSNLTATGAGDKTLTLAGTSTAANTIGGIIPGNGGGTVVSLAKTGVGRWVLSAANTYTGGTTVSAGTLALSGAGTLGGGAVMVAGGMLDLGGLATANVINFQSGALANANQAAITNVLGGATLNTNGLTLGGTVNVTGVLDGVGMVGLIAGSGVVAPGNSPGILTASQLDFSGGISPKFEFTSASVFPTWSNAADSINDVLRLTNANPFNGTTATTANAFDIFFNVSSLNGSEVFVGGIFTDGTSDPLASVSNATFNYYVKGDGGGTVSYKGANYYTLAQYNANGSTSWTVNAGTRTVPVADFAGGTVTNGYVQMFAVPEPSTIGLLLAGMIGVAAGCWARRARG